MTTEDKGDTGSFFGSKVEKTDCRGFDGKTLFRGECPRREPLYTVYKVDGNAVILLEPLRDENIDATTVALDKPNAVFKEVLKFKDSNKPFHHPP